MIKRFLPVFLAAIMILSVFTACADKESTGSESTKSAVVSNTENDPNANVSKDFKKREFLITGLNVSSFFPEHGATEHGDKLLERWDEIEKKYNCTISYKDVTITDFVNGYATSMSAGLYYADLVYSQATYTRSWSKLGYIKPWDELQSVNINAEKFNDPITDMLTYNGHKYGLNYTSWYYQLFGNFTSFLMVNQDLLKRSNQPSPYDLIDKGEWTWDKLRAIAKAVTKDTDGDNETDVWGFGNHIYTQALWANGLDSVVWNESRDKYTFGYVETPAYNALQWALDLTQVDKSVAYKHNSINNPGSATYFLSDIFAKGKAAFIAMDMEWLNYGDGKTTWILDMEDNYGVVPFPLGPDNKNGEYSSQIGTNSWSWFIPANTPNPDEAAFIFDRMSQPLGGTSLADTEAYTLEHYFRGDQKSFKWYKHLLNNSKYTMAMDMGTVAGIPLATTLREMIENKTFTPAEALEREGEAFNNYIDETINSDPNLKPKKAAS